MAGTIVADFIRTDANQLSLNVGNTTFATINASGFFSNTGTQLIAANGKISGASLVSGSITSAAFATAANTIPRSSMTSGAVLQVVSTTKTDSFSSASSSYVDITGLSVSITPTSSTSKILVLATVMVGNAGGNATLNLVRNSTNIAQSTSGTANETVAIDYQASYKAITYPILYLDSPATTSATTYKIQLGGESPTRYINIRASDNYYGSISSITVMEIAA